MSSTTPHVNSRPCSRCFVLTVFHDEFVAAFPLAVEVEKDLLGRRVAGHSQHRLNRCKG